MVYGKYKLYKVSRKTRVLLGWVPDMETADRAAKRHLKNASSGTVVKVYDREGTSLIKTIRK